MLVYVHGDTAARAECEDNDDQGGDPPNPP
jgi:hypothetical protein